METKIISEFNSSALLNGKSHQVCKTLMNFVKIIEINKTIRNIKKSRKFIFPKIVYLIFFKKNTVASRSVELKL